MQVSVETTKGLERKITITIPTDNIDSEIKKRLQNLARTQNMPGFRPGKIPMSVVTKRFGNPIRQEVLQETMQRSFYEAATQEKLQPAGQPLIEAGKLVQGKDFEFVATFEVFPQVKVKAFKKLKIEKVTAEITDKDLDNMLVTLQKQRGTWEPVKRMARNDDMLIINFDGSIDGEPFDGGSAKDFSLVLGSKSMIPGFEKQLLKAKANEERELKVTFPDDYQSKKIAGKDAIFKVSISEVKELKLPEMDDEFVKLFGISEGGIEQLKEEVGNNMRRELEATLKDKIKSSVLDSLREANDVDIPIALIDQEIEALRQQTAKQFNQGAAGKPVDLPEMPAALFEDQAKSRVKLALLVNEIIKTNDITADAEQVRSTIESAAAAYDDPEQMVNWYYSNEKSLQQIESTVIEEQVVDCILESADVTEKKSTFDEIMNKQA